MWKSKISKINYRRIIIFTSPILIEIIASSVRMWSFTISSISGFLFFFFLVIKLYFVFNKAVSKLEILLFVLSGFALININRVFNWNESLISLPDFLMRIVGIISGYTYLSLKNNKKFAIIAISLCVVLPIYTYKYWINFLNYGIVNKPYKVNLSSNMFAGSNFNPKDFGDKFILLDFWHTQCYSCFKSFPALQNVYNQFGKYSNLRIYAVNIPLESDSTLQYQFMIENRGYTFPVLKLLDNNLLKDLKIKYVPTVILLKDNSVLYRGGIEDISITLNKLYLNSHESN